MRKELIPMLALLLSRLLLFSQANVESPAISDSLLQLGDKWYKQKDFNKAGMYWMRSAEAADNAISKNNIYYYAASAFASGKDSVNSLHCLELAITKYGYNDLPALKSDDNFDFMKKDARWGNLLAKIRPAYSMDPLQARIVDSDVRNFWVAYDKVAHDSSHAGAIYKTYYFDKGSMALLDYYVNKLGENLYSFSLQHARKPKFYASIRADTYKIPDYSQACTNSFKALQRIYPEAIFPNVYFVIGKLNSAGTSTSNGLILAIDQLCKTEATDVSELADWEKHYLTPFSNLVPTVAHELVHFQQGGLASDTTLLKAAVLEGMADFIGELICGRSANERLADFAKGKEKAIWTDFKKEMYLDRGRNWTGNGDQETAEKPADLGYWVGYRICKAYYAAAEDKKKAIYDMLHIQDYRAFLEASRVEETFGSTLR